LDAPSTFAETSDRNTPLESIVRLHTVLVALAVVACSGDHKPAAIPVPHGPLAALMTQHGTSICERSTRTYPNAFFRPPYQACSSGDADSTESAEIDADSVVVELYNTWALTPANHASGFAQAEADVSRVLGDSRECSATKAEWRKGDTLHVVLQVKPVSDVGTEFDEGPWRMTRIARLGPLDPAKWGC
jgi:hypothetical protein